MSKKYDLIAVGEIMMRLSPAIGERLSNGKNFERYIGGAEFNVVAGVSNMELNTAMISVLPQNCIGDYARRIVRQYGVDDSNILNDNSKEARLGVYYYENGANPRKPSIAYDRLNSSFSRINTNDLEENIFESTKCFHTSGITLGLNENCRKETIKLIKKFKEAGAVISFDVNYRMNLWSGEEARKAIEEILPYVDIFFCSEDTAKLTFKKTGNIYEIIKSFCEEYPIKYFAATQRTVHSPKVHSFGSVLYNSSEEKFYEEEEYKNIEVVDRIGSGDSYVSGILYGLLSGKSCEEAVAIGNAMGAIKNTISGDISCVTKNEIESIIKDHKNKSDRSEMVR